MKPDIAQLYSQLDLRPDCGLDDLKRAYRRRISELHPDKPGTGSADAGSLRISELNSLYDEAMRFHRAHGRLPGAPPSPSRRNRSTATVPMLVISPDAARARAHAAARRRTTMIAVLLIVLLVLLMILLD